MPAWKVEQITHGTQQDNKSIELIDTNLVSIEFSGFKQFTQIRGSMPLWLKESELNSAMYVFIACLNTCLWHTYKRKEPILRIAKVSAS